MLHDDDDAIHGWFGLSYAGWLVMPRVVLQSMPGEWQAKMVALLNEMSEAMERADIELPCTRVQGVEYDTGRIVSISDWGSYKYPVGSIKVKLNKLKEPAP